MKIGIMGGTFNPIHKGHLMLGAYAYENFHLDKIWFLPNGNPPHKDSEIAAKQRLDMVRLAIAGDDRFSLNAYEAERSEKSYSYETLETFHKKYPEHEFYFIIGADSLFSIESWKEPARVMKACTLLAACRDDKEPEDIKGQIAYLEGKYDASVQYLKAPYMPVSSSEIRKLVKQQADILQYVPASVACYIKEHHLYQSEEF